MWTFALANSIIQDMFHCLTSLLWPRKKTFRPIIKWKGINPIRWLRGRNEREKLEGIIDNKETSKTLWRIAKWLYPLFYVYQCCIDGMVYKSFLIMEILENWQICMASSKNFQIWQTKEKSYVLFKIMWSFSAMQRLL